jgi:hypothetical protein
MLQAAQKISEARRAKFDERRRTWAVRCSEAIERNEAYESFQQPALLVFCGGFLYTY